MKRLSPLTNGEMNGLLQELQKFWIFWRDKAENTEECWDRIVRDANRIYLIYGDSSADLIASFIKQIEYRIIPEEEVQEEERDYTH